MLRRVATYTRGGTGHRGDGAVTVPRPVRITVPLVTVMRRVTCARLRLLSHLAPQSSAAG